MDFVFAIWFLTTITAWFLGIVIGVIDPIHQRRPFKKYYDSWGGYRFYTLAVPVFILLAPLWFVPVLYIYINGLIKKK